GQGLHPAVVQVRAAVEAHLGDAGLPGARGDQLADPRRDLGLLETGDPAAHFLVERRRGGQRAAGLVVDQLAVDVRVAAEHRQPRARGVAAHALAHAPRLALAILRPQLCDVSHVSFASWSLRSRRSERLAGLAPDDLVLVLEALALVRLGRLQLPDLRRELADLLQVGTAHDQVGRVGHLDGHRRRHRDLDRIGVAGGERQGVLALRLDRVADAVELELALVALSHALDHVAQQGTGQPVVRTRRLVVLRTDVAHGDRVALDLDRDLRPVLVGQFALRPLHGDLA